MRQILAQPRADPTTVALPESWQGSYTVERARAWIAERDAESPTLLVMEAASARPVGVVVLAEVPLDESMVDVRIGYVIAEASWGTMTFNGSPTTKAMRRISSTSSLRRSQALLIDARRPGSRRR